MTESTSCHSEAESKNGSRLHIYGGRGVRAITGRRCRLATALLPIAALGMVVGLVVIRGKTGFV
ncbi:MAG: hypothetical protein R3E08_08785 [Thiotrichaceae bacterium]